jgi:hypothetical protein
MYFTGISNRVEIFTATLADLADLTVSKISSKARKLAKLWFNDSCKVAVNDRRDPETADGQPFATNLENFHVLRAKAPRVVRLAKREIDGNKSPS